MSKQAPTKQHPLVRYRQTLAPTMIISIIIFSLLPVLLVGAFSVIFFQRNIQSTITDQIHSFTSQTSQQFDLLASSQIDDLVQFSEQEGFQSLVSKLNQENLSAAQKSVLLEDINDFFRETPSAQNRNILLVDETGVVVTATNSDWINSNWAEYHWFKSTDDLRKSFLVFSPFAGFDGQFVLFSQLPVGENAPKYNLVAASVTNLPQTTLSAWQSIHQQAEAYVFTSNDLLVGLNGSTTNLTKYKTSEPQLNSLIQLRASQQPGGKTVLSDQDSTYAYGYSIPSLNSVLVVAAPIKAGISLSEIPFPWLIGIFGAILLCFILLLVILSQNLIFPMVQFAETAKNLANNEWTPQLTINRKDEIGLLAASINQISDSLSRLNQLAQDRIEERVSQIKTTSEITRLVISAKTLEEVENYAVETLIEQTNAQWVGFYLVDDSSEQAHLKAFRAKNPSTNINKDLHVPINSQSALGWVAVNNQTFFTNDLSQEGIFQQSDAILADTKSQIILPLAINHKVIGAIDIQQNQLDAFKAESTKSLEKTASQIAIALNNVLLVDTAQQHLPDIQLVDKSSLLLAQKKNSADAIQELQHMFSQMDYVAVRLLLENDQLKFAWIQDKKGSPQDSSLLGLAIPAQREIPLLSSQSSIVYQDLSDQQEFTYLLDFFARRACKHVAILPILVNGIPAQVIAIGSRNDTPFNSTFLSSIVNAKNILGNTLELSGTLKSLENRLQETETITAITQAISLETDMSQLFEILHQQIVNQIGANLNFLVALYNSKTDFIEVPYAKEGSQLLQISPFPLGEGLTSIVIKQKKSLKLIKNTEQAARDLGAKIVGKPARSWMGIPLFVRGEVIGAMILQDQERDNRFTDEHLNLFTRFGAQVAVAIRNAQLLTEMTKALQAYDQERFLLSSLLADIPEKVYFKDRQGKYLRVSSSFVKEHGYSSADEMMEHTDVELFGETNGQEIFANDKAVMDSNSPRIGEIGQKQEINGKITWQLVSRIPLTNANNEVVGIMGISQDISELKSAEDVIQRRASYLLTAAEIARNTNGTLQVEEVLKRATDLIRERFGHYHASVFLLDPLGKHLVLREASGDSGQILRRTGHRLAVGSRSIVGQATEKRETMIRNNVYEDPNYYPNPYLTDTRAELTIPLISGNTLLGALDVQSKSIGAFTPEDVNVLEILADQLAVAVSNANLYAEAQDNLAKHRLIHQITSAASTTNEVHTALETIVSGLHTALGGDRVSVYILNQQELLEIQAAAGYENIDFKRYQTAIGEGVVGFAAMNRRPYRVSDTLTDPHYITIDDQVRSELAIPILYTDQLIGVLNIESQEVAAYDESDQEILGTLGNNIGAIIQNARLLSQISSQVERQEQLFEITSKIRRSVDIETILRTSATELARALNAKKAEIEISIGSETKKTENNHTAPAGNHGNNGKYPAQDRNLEVKQ